VLVGIGRSAENSSRTQGEMDDLVATRESDGDGEHFKTVLFHLPINSPFLGRGSG
jgi:hypothetical protein